VRASLIESYMNTTSTSTSTTTTNINNDAQIQKNGTSSHTCFERADSNYCYLVFERGLRVKG